MNASITEYAKNNIKEIHGLSARYNGYGRDHTEVLLGLVGKHACEINGLYRNGDDHFSVEVGDLLVLCYELLLEQKKDPDEIMEICYSRYKRKITELMNARETA
ncbi:MAG: hypothetical protein ABH883_08970 [Candidatus Omnitrophota bacterium]